MSAWPVPTRRFAPLIALERSRLLDVLDSLEPADWDRPSPCPGWSVLGLATHLVGDDLSFLAWHRDDHHGTPPPDGLDEHGFIAWLDELQVEWVEAARRLSPRLAIDLLGWLGDQVTATVAAQDPSAVTAIVSWASTDPVPVWLDQARELAERWIHRQQILQALDRASDVRPDLAEPVLDGLRWAYPHRLGAVTRPDGTSVAITVSGPEVELAWTLVSRDRVWRFSPSIAEAPAAQLEMTTEQAWRLLTNNLVRELHGAPVASGDEELLAALVRTRAIIGEPA
jgi:uncharacterized protein (TIGR03083 family)